VRSILVVELWKLGDLVLMTPTLQALRRHYPSARITLLAQPVAATLLAGTDLVDEFVPFSFPWTSEAGKYSPRRYRVREMVALLRRLRSSHFDLLLDAREDRRNELLGALIGAERRVGLSGRGSALFLTDPVTADDSHRVDDWMRLVRHLGYTGSSPGMELAVSEDERVFAERWLSEQGASANDALVALHTGASVPLKKWDAGKFAELARRASARGARVLIFEDPQATPMERIDIDGVIRVRLPLREMLAVAICNDSGPLHIAAALGVPTIGIFTNQLPELYAPRGDSHEVVIKTGFACRPCFERCRYAEPYCNTSISVDDLWNVVESRIASHSTRGQQLHASRLP
jgi:heptosyltransferase II